MDELLAAPTEISMEVQRQYQVMKIGIRSRNQGANWPHPPRIWEGVLVPQAFAMLMKLEHETIPLDIFQGNHLSVGPLRSAN